MMNIRPNTTRSKLIIVIITEQITKGGGLSMNISRLSLLTVLFLTSCASNQQKYNNVKILTPKLGVNSYGNVQFRGKDFNCTTITGTGTNYKDIIKDFEKAKEWDAVKKSTSLKKSINTYIACRLDLEYSYNVSTNKSKVTACFQNPIYSSIVDINCVTFNDYDSVIKALNKAPEAMIQLNKEIDAADSLH